MQINFYKTADYFHTLYLLLSKGRGQEKTFNVFFESEELAKDFSVFLWNKSSLGHGLVSEGYFHLQPIILIGQDAFEQEMKKDIAIFVAQDVVNNKNIENWEKVFFIDSHFVLFEKYSKYNPQCWEYINKTWKKID